MNNDVQNVLIFTVGAVIGSVVTWKLLKTKYEKIAQDEIDSVKATFSTVYKSKDEGDDVEKEPEPRVKFTTTEKPDIMEYAAKLQKEGYTNYSNTNPDEKKDDTNSVNSKPRVIPPEDHGEFLDYTTITLTYYADGVLTDDNDEPISDVEGLVGDALNHFGEYEDDSVYVQDDRLEIYYEILLDDREYYPEVAPTKPRPAGV